MKPFFVAPSVLAFGALLVGACGSPARAQTPPVKPPVQIGGTDVALMHALSNAKQIGIACLMKAADSGDTFKIGPATFKSDVSPYLKNVGAFTSPLDKPGTQSFQFNKSLQNVSQKKVKNSANTVMVYEGAWGKPLFRYSGNALIVFADGHAKQISPTQAKGLLWKP